MRSQSLAACVRQRRLYHLENKVPERIWSENWEKGKRACNSMPLCAQVNERIRVCARFFACIQVYLTWNIVHRASTSLPNMRTTGYPSSHTTSSKSLLLQDYAQEHARYCATIVVHAILCAHRCMSDCMRAPLHLRFCARVIAPARMHTHRYMCDSVHASSHLRDCTHTVICVILWAHRRAAYSMVAATRNDKNQRSRKEKEIVIQKMLMSKQ